MRYGRKEAAKSNKLYDGNSQVPGCYHRQDEVAGEKTADMSKVATVAPVLAETENSTSTLPRYWSRLWPQSGLVSCPRNSRYFVAIKMGRRQGARREHI